MPQEECVFCAIANKLSPADIVFEDEFVLVLTPLHPVAKGHVLVIPKTHYRDIFDIDQDTLNKVAITAQSIARAQREQYQATGINLLQASGADAQQSIFHFHLHVVPRYPNDGLDLWYNIGIEKK